MRVCAVALSHTHTHNLTQGELRTLRNGSALPRYCELISSVTKPAILVINHHPGTSIIRPRQTPGELAGVPPLHINGGRGAAELCVALSSLKGQESKSKFTTKPPGTDRITGTGTHRQRTRGLRSPLDGGPSARSPQVHPSPPPFIQATYKLTAGDQRRSVSRQSVTSFLHK